MRKIILTKEAPVKDGVGLELYFKEIAKYPKLSAEEERNLFLRYQAGDQRARDLIVKHNLLFVIKVAKQYQRSIYGLQLSDLISMGNMGMLKAIDKFDLSKNVKFISMAVHWIRQSITEQIKTYNTVIDYPQNYYLVNNKIKNFSDAFERKHERTPSSDEVGEYIEECGMKVTQSSDIFNGKVLSLNLAADSHDISSPLLIEVMEDPNAQAPDASFEAEERAMAVNRLMAGISEREAYIINHNYGLNGCPVMSLDAIAEEMGVTTERVRQIRRATLSKFKKKADKLF
jgi:RNA polymerase primary sigma factor